MRTNSRQLLPTAFELWYVALASGALLVAGNAKLFLEHYGLIGSSTVVGEQVSGRFASGLGVLDSFSFTPGLVTFITWGGIGLVVFSASQALARASGIIKFERDISSNRYVHPQNFNRSHFWRRIIGDAILSFVLISLVAIAGTLYLLFIIPVSFNYVQRFLLQAGVAHLGALVLGAFTIFTGTELLYLLVKLTAWHHRISQQ